MSDTIPTNPAPDPAGAPQPAATDMVAASPPKPAAPAADPGASPPSLAPVRAGFACVLAFFGIVLLAVAIIYFFFPQRVQSLKGVAKPTWSALFGQSAVWPGGVWSLTFGLAAAGGAYVLATGLKRPDRDSAAWLRRVLACTLLAAGLAAACVVGYHLARAPTFGAGFHSATYWALGAAIVLLGGGAYVYVLPPSPAPVGDHSLALVRLGLAGFVAALGLLLLLVSYFYFVYPGTIQTPTEVATADWKTLFKQKAVWPVAVWGLVFGLAAIAGAYVLMTGLDQPERNSTKWVAQATAYVFLGGALALIGVSAFLFYREGNFQIAVKDPTNLWAMLTAGVVGVAGLFLLTDAAPQADKIRQFLLGAGIMVGAMTFLLGVGLATVTFADFTEGMATWKRRPAVLAVPVVAYVGGLLLLFLAVQPADVLVRGSQTIRRAVAWSNFAVTTLLLMGLLAIVFVMSFANPLDRFFGRAYDWTASGFHSLSPITRDYLANLREPVKVYVIMEASDPVRQDVVTMLDNCRSLNSNVSYELLDPSRESHEEQIITLMERYGLNRPLGVLVVTAGADKGGGSPLDKAPEKGGNPLEEKVKKARKGEFIHIKTSELSDREEMRQRGPYVFKGEVALVNALLTLQEGQVKIYFTEGHGELPLSAGMDFARRQGRGGTLATLRDHLADRDSVKVEPLKLDKPIPNDANVVVIARPTETFGADEVKILRDYLKREHRKRKEKPREGGPEREVTDVTTGRLILLLDAKVQKLGGKTSVVPTGLEEFLADYNVKLGNDRILVSRQQGADQVFCITNDKSENPIAKAFQAERGSTLFLFGKTRTVEAVQGGKGSATAEPLVIAVPHPDWGQSRLWGETNFDAPTFALQKEVLTNRAKLAAGFGTQPLPIAVAVSDRGGGGFPMDKHHAPLRDGKEEPRLIVFGTSTWLTDEEVDFQRSELAPGRVSLFKSCVGWMNRSAVGSLDVPDKKRVPYNPAVKEDSQWWLYRLPILLMLAAIVVIGAGVWVVRRR